MADVDNTELKPCPFCGGAPSLPSGYGTQYEIDCSECGSAFGSVQISDLMTLEERAADPFTNYRYAEEFIERARQQASENWNTRPVEDALLARIAELELLADDARGKRCPDCSAPMVNLSTIDGGQRVCSGCNKTWDWHLKEGQQPLIGNNRMVNKV